MKRVNVLFQSDNNFAFMVGVAFASLLQNASKDIFYDIYIFELNYSEENKQKFYSLKEKYPELNYRLTFIDATQFNQLFIDLGVEAHRGSYVTYFKLLLARVFKDTDVDKIIHIGADTLVTGDLAELADFDFEGAPFAMNYYEKTGERYYPKGIRTCIAEMIYFNLPVWNEMKCEDRILRHIQEIGDLYGNKDQGLMNVEFAGEYAQLPTKFNAYSFCLHFNEKNLIRYHNAEILTKEEILDAYENPQIIHYARSFLYRPCEKDSTFIGKEVWWDYCNNSPWAGMKPLEGQPTLGAKEKLFRWMYAHLSLGFCDWCYIYSRRLFGWWLALTHPAKEKSKIGPV